MSYEFGETIEYGWGYAMPDGHGGWTLVHKDARPVEGSSIKECAIRLTAQLEHSVRFRRKWLETAESAIKDLEELCGPA